MRYQSVVMWGAGQLVQMRGAMLFAGQRLQRLEKQSGEDEREN